MGASGPACALLPSSASLSPGPKRSSEAMPLCYPAELIGVGEKAIWWLIVLMVLTCDPLAITLTAAASASRCVSGWSLGEKVSGPDDNGLGLTIAQTNRA
jgi:hypothetical protein